MIPPTRHGFFLSLKWKALLLSSIALVVVTGALVTINYIELLNQFEQRRAESQNQYAHQVQGLLELVDPGGNSRRVFPPLPGDVGFHILQILC